MNGLGQKIYAFILSHRNAVLFWAVLIVSAGMIFKGIMQRPQINYYKEQIAELDEQIRIEQDRQTEIDELSSKVNTDEYIEKIASEKLGLVKNNSKIFIDVSEDN